MFESRLLESTPLFESAQKSPEYHRSKRSVPRMLGRPDSRFRFIGALFYMAHVEESVLLLASFKTNPSRNV